MFPGLPQLQFSIVCIMQKFSCILQAIEKLDGGNIISGKGQGMRLCAGHTEVSPSNCCLSYCKKAESDWLLNSRYEWLTDCVKQDTGRTK